MEHRVVVCAKDVLHIQQVRMGGIQRGGIYQFLGTTGLNTDYADDCLILEYKLPMVAHIQQRLFRSAVLRFA